MTYAVLSDDGRPLDAHLDVEGSDIVFHSRGGTRGGPGLRNADYGPGLRLLLKRLRSAHIEVAGAWVDSGQVQHLPIDVRAIMGAEDSGRDPSDQFRLLAARMKEVGRERPGHGGNSTKRIRLRLAGSQHGLETLLGLRQVKADLRSQKRLPADLLNTVEADHVWRAVQRLLAGEMPAHYGPSTDFDLLVDGARLPPKAVFGLAASEALGFPVQPVHFSGGVGTPCFRILVAAGFEIVPKEGVASRPEEPPPALEDLIWMEGRPRLVAHLRRERAAGLAAAKKAAFRREHGRLLCERCGLDPIAKYGASGEACIEVHHRETHLAAMSADHTTRLDDVECLCANCHRVVHAEAR